MRIIVRGSLLGKYFSELHQPQRTLDFACGKGGIQLFQLTLSDQSFLKLKDKTERQCG